MKSFSLIVPIAAEKPSYKQKMPYVFNLDNDGIMFCIKAILGLNLDKFDKIYFTILKKHDNLYLLSDFFKIQFKRLKLSKAKVVVLENPTMSQPDTIYQTIKKENIKGGIFVKDADCYFKCDVELKNSIAIYSLENLAWVNPQHKSYVSVDDMFYVTNIIEKKIISHYFCAGGYCFEDASDFVRTFSLLSCSESLYLSHIIYYMLLKKSVFRPIIVNLYKDYECYEMR